VHFVANRPRNAAGQDVAGDHFPARTRVPAWRPRTGRVAPGFDADPLAVAGNRSSPAAQIVIRRGPWAAVVDQTIAKA
jgi:hypothetical protein